MKLRVDRLLKESLPGAAEEERLREIDAKRLLAAAGPLARGLGRSLPSGRIASAMRKGEMHADVLELFARLQAGLRGAALVGDSDDP